MNLKSILYREEQEEIIERIIIKLKLTNYLAIFSVYLNKYFEYFASKKVNYKNTDILIG